MALPVLNLVGFLTTRSQAARGLERFTAWQSPGDLLLERRREDGYSHRRGEVLSSPGVAAAFAAGPQLWHQVSYLYDTRFEPTTR